MNSPPSKLRRQSYAPVHFPDALIPEVLSFCTVKSLLRFSCVNKSWNSLISDSTFIDLHRRRSRRNPHLTLLSGEPQSDADSSVVPFPVRSFLDNQSIVLPVGNPDYKLKEKDCRWVVGSCNGLLCLLGYAATANCRMIWFRIWNPATRKLSERLGRFIDRAMGLHTLFRFAFGYDDSTRTYKIVGVLGAVVKVFCLGDNAWREIQNFPVITRNRAYPYHYTNPGVNDSVYLSSSLNWLALNNRYWKNLLVEEFVIVSLDLCTETYTQFMPPRGFHEIAPVEPTISVLMEKLCYFHDFKRTDIVIWQMMEFGVEESWTPLVRISYQSLQSMHHDSTDLAYFQWLPLHLSGNSDTLILANNQERQALLYNLRDNTVERTTNADAIHWFSAKDYVESLVPVS